MNFFRNVSYFYLLFFICFGSLYAKEKEKELPVVAIITTGGTIAETTDPETGASVPSLSGEDLIESIPELKKIAKLKVVNFSNIDSSQMSPEIWAKLSKVVDEVLSDSTIKGAVITHGTDTMAEGAYFLELTLKTKKPVVFVGAMRNSSSPYSDGPLNLINAVRQAVLGDIYDWGVTVTMNQYVNSARSVEKTQTTNVQTFESGEKGYLGYINGGRVYHLNDRTHKLKLPLPRRLPRVVLYTDYSGADGSMLRSVLNNEIDGIVIESFGSGNVNAAVFEVVKEAIRKGIAVVITSRVFYGGVFPEYGDEGGGKTLEEAGAVVCGNLRGPKARLLLTLLLYYEGNNSKRLKKYFNY